jgi:adenylyl-sulfate kinase
VTPSDQPSTPIPPGVQLSDAAVADLQLVLDGVGLPWATLGGSLGDGLGGGLGGGPADAGGGSAADSRGSVDVLVPQDTARAALEAGSLVLTDREQTPVAALSDLSQAAVDASSAGLVVLQGTVHPRRSREARLFLDRAARPGQLSAANGSRHVLVAGRPLLTEDIERLRGVEDLLILVPVEGATPDGLPPVALMRSVWPVASRLGGRAKVVAAPMFWRDAASDLALTRALSAAYGGASSELLSGGAAWSGLLTGLATDDHLPDVADQVVLDELRHWRPVPAQRGTMVLFTGFSGSGKSTLARDLAAYVVEHTPRTVSLLDGDDVRRLLSAGLGFDHAGRDLNVRRIGYVGSEIARHGGLAICAPIAPYAESRAAVRAMVEPVGQFVLIHVSTPLEECERRDLKGLYAKARAGVIPEFTGISDPYDVPTDADLAVDTSRLSRDEALQQVLDLLRTAGLVDDDPSLITLADSET